ncbi:MAG: hypothetical protein B6244_03170 [Candidatus Cloacimonetes bacterium 4572_55]|nr:MAG: hypothetical protein B6244_03170 [Candidatus Cloacimonetes bacterium 4572_55]
MMNSRFLIGLCLFLIIMNMGGPVFADSEAVPDHIILRLNSDLSTFDLNKILEPIHTEAVKQLVPSMNIWLTKIDLKKIDLETALSAVRKLSETHYAQKDHLTTLREDPLFPNDPMLGEQWNFHDSDDTDIDAPEAWGLADPTHLSPFGEELVVAIIDNGFQYDHDDLIDNVWFNEHEIPNDGIDNDNNGYVDDYWGWDVYDGDGELPVQSHGTHVAGIIGAMTDNEYLVAGVNWHGKMLCVAGESSLTSIVSQAYNYVITVKTQYIESDGEYGANIVSSNSSFGIDQADCQSGDYPIWNDLYNEMGSLGILSAGATANRNWDIDEQGDVPTSCDSPYLISVTGTNTNDERAYAFGATTIDLAAPGVSVTSTRPSNSTGTGSGTSYACPHVAGAIEFLYAVGSVELAEYYLDHPDSASLVVKQILLDSVDPLPSLQPPTSTVSGGRLNLYQAGLLAMTYPWREDSTIVVTVISDTVAAGETAHVPIHADFPEDSLFSSFEMWITGYESDITLTNISIDSTLIGDAEWMIEAYQTDDALIIAAAGAEDIGGQGTLLRLMFDVPNDLVGFIPIHIDSVIFDTGETPVQAVSGGVMITSVIDYGDVDLNGLVQAYDASHILKYLVNQIELNDIQLLNADVTIDETVSSLDASVILQYITGSISELPYDSSDVFIATGNITMRDGGIPPNQLFETPLYLSEESNIYGFEAVIGYDPSLLTYIDTVWSDQWDDFAKAVQIDSINGQIHIVGAGRETPGIDSLFATIQFRSNGSVGNNTTVSLDQLRWNEGEVQTDVAFANFEVVSIQEDEISGYGFRLDQNYPNPFNPHTTISFTLPEDLHVTLKLYDLTGRLIHTLVEGEKSAGVHQIDFDANNLASGLYFYELSARNTVSEKLTNFNSRKKMLFLK